MAGWDCCERTNAGSRRAQTITEMIAFKLIL
jgi:hypothetical protein